MAMETPISFDSFQNRGPKSEAVELPKMNEGQGTFQAIATCHEAPLPLGHPDIP